MSLIDDLKTFVLALALGVALTLSINYVVVNYTEGSASAQAAHNEPYRHDDAGYEAPTPAATYESGGSYYSAY